MKKAITTVSLILVIVIAMFFFWKYGFTYSDGFRVGLLQKFSRKGMFFKTYEGEMILSSVRTSNDMAIASEKFLFSVTEKTLALKFNDLQGEYIIVHYREKNGTLPWRGESKYIVDSVRVKTEKTP